MTDPTQEVLGRIGRRQVLAALLALAMLIPLGVLYLGRHQYLGEHRSMAAQERHGIEYLLALGKLTIALTDAQSAAVRGEPVAQEALAGAVAGVAEMDDRFGAELRAGERWSQLRETIELAGTEHADGRAAYAAYGEATSQLLGLHDRLRETTGLVRDPDADAYHLQDAAAGQLPPTIVASAQLADLLTLTAAEPAGAPLAQQVEISTAADAVAGPADKLVVGVQAALDSTASRSLSSAVLSKYDRFLRVKDGLLAAVPADGNVENVDFELIEFFRSELRAAGDDLYATLLTELDTLIQDRAGALARDRWTALGAVSAGLLLALGAAVVGLSRGARQPTGESRPGQLVARGSGRELPQSRNSISDSAAGSGAWPGTPPAAGLPPGQLVGPERVDVR
jgi:hypothetical protein